MNEQNSLRYLYYDISRAKRVLRKDKKDSEHLYGALLLASLECSLLSETKKNLSSFKAIRFLLESLLQGPREILSLENLNILESQIISLGKHKVAAIEKETLLHIL